MTNFSEFNLSHHLQEAESAVYDAWASAGKPSVGYLFTCCGELLTPALSIQGVEVRSIEGHVAVYVPADRVNLLYTFISNHGCGSIIDCSSMYDELLADYNRCLDWDIEFELSEGPGLAE